MKEQVSTPHAPAAVGPYSQAVRAGNTLYVSGQLPIDPVTGASADDSVRTLATHSLTNIRRIVEAAGFEMDNVVKTTVFLTDINDFAEMNEVYKEFFTAPYPARSAVAVRSLPKGARLEIECIAVKD